jgi:type IV secretory pathway VirB6-like protein
MKLFDKTKEFFLDNQVTFLAGFVLFVIVVVIFVLL